MSKITKTLVQLIVSFASIKNASFVGIRNYFIDCEKKNSRALTSGYKNMLINIGIDRDLLKGKDRKKLLSLNKAEFFESFVNGLNSKFDYPLFLKAYDSVFDQCTIIGQTLANGTKKADLTAKQKAMLNAFQTITKGIKYHPEYDKLYISGIYVNSSECKGLPMPTYKQTKKQTKTLIQDIIKNELKLESFNHRTLTLNNVGIINASKTSFNGKDLIIDVS